MSQIEALSRTADLATEEDRLRAVATYEFMVGADNVALREMCMLAKTLFDVPLAFISLVRANDVMLLTHETQRKRDYRQRDESYSTFAILSDTVTVLHDLNEDPRFAHFEKQAKFYAGAPLIAAPGLNVGAFCLLDEKKRSFGPEDEAQLERLAFLAMNELRRGLLTEELRRTETMMAQACALAKLGCWEVYPKTGKIVWTDQMYDLMDVPRDQPALSPPEFLARVAPHDRAEVELSMKRRDVDYGVQQVEFIRPNGESRWIKTIKKVELVDGEVERVYGFGQDVTDLHLTQAKVERLAYQDPLTGLPNRSLFNARFQQAVERAAESGKKVGLIMVDIDHFKDINDTLGHDAGDALLLTVADLLKGSYRSTDTVARLGGDEFAIVLPDVRDMQDLTRPTKALMDLLRHPVEHGGQVFTISASVGAALYPADNDDAGELMKNADIALYQAKAEGRNRIVTYDPAMRDKLNKRVENLREIRQGLAEGAFELYYQPLVSLEPGSIAGFEALMRWNHPTRGLLSPETFMAGFEDPDLALLLGDLSFDSALKQMRAWLEQGLEFGRVAVNISAAQFRDPDLAERIEGKLKYWGVSPERLTIEVTENVYMGWGSEVVGETARRLHEAGVLIALDDFGTGYASLTNLKQFPVDRLKIDKSFVQNPDDQAIVQAVINLGASLGMKVVAEGVEQSDQLAFLSRQGCDQVQGFFFSEPMPSSEVPRFLREFVAERATAEVA